MLEPSDVNDGAILNGTRQEAGPGESTRFRITLPSGREVVSEWIAPENIKKALLMWCETIRQQVAADANASQELAKERARMAKRVKEEEARTVAQSGTSSAPTAPTVATTNGSSASTDQPPGASSDPLEYAKAQLLLAQESVDYWFHATQKADENHRNWSATRNKWAGIVRGLQTEASTD